MAVVIVPPLLREFTGDAERVEVEGATLRRVINELERRFGQAIVEAQTWASVAPSPSTHGTRSCVSIKPR